MKDILGKIIHRNSKRIPYFFEQNNYALIGKLSSSILHDILTPLTSLTLANDANPAQASFANTIVQNSTTELKEYIDILRNFLYQENKPINIEVNAEIKKSILLLKHKLISNNIQLQFIEFDHIQTTIHPLHIYQIIINLVSNAIEASVHSKTKKILLLLKKVDQYFQIECRDFGSGIPDEILKYAGKKCVSSKSKKRGFGLYSVYYIVEHVLQGKITITTNSNSGTLFTCKIPLS